MLGITASQLVNYAIAQGAGGKSQNKLGALHAWQWMLMAAAVPALAYLVLSFMIPESPRWLVAAGQLDQARAVLDEIDDDDTDERIADIQHVDQVRATGRGCATCSAAASCCCRSCGSASVSRCSSSWSAST